MRRKRAGVVLLEAIVALFLVGATTAASLSLLRQATSAHRRSTDHDQQLRQADRLLASVSLWSREDLDRHLGARSQGPWMLEVQRPLPGLYHVVVVERAGGREWLRTTLYRVVQP